VPAGYRGIKTAITDTLGASISFPSTWLISPMAGESLEPGRKLLPFESVPASTVVDALQQAVRPHIHEFNLDARRIAEICGLSKRTLARKLQIRGTNARQEIIALRRARAEMELKYTNKPVAEIATMVGYTDLAVFSRAFKRWTGTSPRYFRQQSRAESA